MAVTLDNIRDLEARERFGVLVYLRRQAVVTGLAQTDYAVLKAALADASVPDNGDFLSGDSNLVLTTRNVRVVPDSPSTCEVELIYEHTDNEGQNLTDPPYGLAITTSHSSLQQITTELDADASQITVAHTWPDTDDDWPGEAITQGGEITVMIPQETIRVQGMFSTTTPWRLVDEMIGHVNSSAWMGGAAATWLCTDAHYSFWDFNTGICRVSFEFQYNMHGWNPDVFFIDPRTNKPPPSLVLNTGYKTITWYPTQWFDYVLVPLLGR